MVSNVRCVEIYLPKKLKYISKIYDFLRLSVENRISPYVIDGFSIYEVDGTFWSPSGLFEDRTMVIRLLLIQTSGQDERVILTKINEIGRILSTDIAEEELEIWIVSDVQQVHIYQGLQHLISK